MALEESEPKAIGSATALRAIATEPINEYCSRCGDWLIIGFSDEQLANAWHHKLLDEGYVVQLESFDEKWNVRAKNLSANHFTAVLIAGDIFDKPKPSNESLLVFKSFTVELVRLNTPVVAIAGNHDSPSLIDTETQLWRLFGSHIIGTERTAKNGGLIRIPTRCGTDLTGRIKKPLKLFAITGPKGAGKSSILDAICLVLYDKSSCNYYRLLMVFYSSLILSYSGFKLPNGAVCEAWATPIRSVNCCVSISEFLVLLFGMVSIGLTRERLTLCRSLGLGGKPPRPVAINWLS